MYTEETLQILEGARELLTEPNRWTKGISARDYKGKQTWCLGPTACCWCLTGALRRAALELSGVLFLEPLKPTWRKSLRFTRLILADVIEPDWESESYDASDVVIEFNDHGDTTHHDVLVAIDAAIIEVEENLDV